ncbi:hypothetical protein BDB13_5686 [Rhodococcus sp. OK302]|nr:hypothetical protein BDB13_5686 [Rhodococcus sp. OK302]
MRAGLVVVGGLSPLILASCTSGDSTSAPAAPAASEAESAPADTTAGSTQCAAAAAYYEDNLFGREWLLAYKQDPTVSGVALRRCHYSHERYQDGPVPPSPDMADDGELVPPSSVITDDAEVQRIILSLPDSTDVGKRCGPYISPYERVYTFDEYTVLDPSGTPVATFQTSEMGPCGINNIVPST